MYRKIIRRYVLRRAAANLSMTPLGFYAVIGHRSGMFARRLQMHMTSTEQKKRSRAPACSGVRFITKLKTDSV